MSSQPNTQSNESPPTSVVVAVVGVVTLTFGIFGAIPAAIMSARQKKIGVPSRLPWKVFAWTMCLEVIGVLAIGGAVYFSSQSASQAASQQAAVSYVESHKPSSLSYTAWSNVRGRYEPVQLTAGRIWRDTSNSLNVAYQLEGEDWIVVCVNQPDNRKCGDGGYMFEPIEWNGMRVILGNMGNKKVRHVLGSPDNDTGLLKAFVSALG